MLQRNSQFLRVIIFRYAFSLPSSVTIGTNADRLLLMCSQTRVPAFTDSDADGITTANLSKEDVDSGFLFVYTNIFTTVLHEERLSKCLLDSFPPRPLSFLEFCEFFLFGFLLCAQNKAMATQIRHNTCTPFHVKLWRLTTHFFSLSAQFFSFVSSAFLCFA